MFKFWRTNNAFLILLYYVLGLSLVIGAHYLDPTNMAGPGLDVPAFLIYLLVNALFFSKTLVHIFKKTAPVLDIIFMLVINIAGFISIILLLFTPANAY